MRIKRKPQKKRAMTGKPAYIWKTFDFKGNVRFFITWREFNFVKEKRREHRISTSF